MKIIQNGNFKKTYLVDSFETFLNILRDIKNENQNNNLWFRGQKDQALALKPGIFRYAERLTEHGTIETSFRLENSYAEIYPNVSSELQDFRDLLIKQKIPEYMIPKNSLELMYLGQHYNLLTPLLDFTTDPLVALFFAINELQGIKIEKDIQFYFDEFNDENDYIDKAADIYLLLPNIINQYSYIIKQKKLFQISESNLTDYNDLMNLKKIPYTPMCLLAPKNDYRIIRQSGNFLYYGEYMVPIDKYPNKKDFLYKIIIPYCLINELKSLLELLDITENTISKDNPIYSQNAEYAACKALYNFKNEILSITV